jgi:hypothetical protein
MYDKDSWGMQYVQALSYTVNSSQRSLAFNKNAVSNKTEHCVFIAKIDMLLAIIAMI